MTPTLVAAAALTAALAYLAARRRAARRADPADTAPHALDWLTAADLRPLPGGGTVAGTADGWRTVTVHGLQAATDLLDALEAAGYEEQELIVLGNSVFAVRWR